MTLSHSQQRFPAGEGFGYPLLPMAPSFRLLRLSPGLKSDPLVGQLETHTLDVHPPYEGVSYTWGPPEKSHRMTLNDSVFEISAKVQATLCRMRRPTDPRLLWIDAICINQDDNLERAAQVVHMTQIYSQATRVLCYIGEDAENHDSRVAMRLIQQIGRADFTQLPEATVSAAFMEEQGLPPAGDISWWHLLHFLKQPWFRRCWIVQEFVSGAECLMICGEAETSWKYLRSGFDKAGEYTLLSLSLHANRERGSMDLTGSAHDLDLAENSLLAIRTMLAVKSMASFTDGYSNLVRGFAQGDETAQRELVEGSWDHEVPGTKSLVETIRKDPETSDSTLALLRPLLENMFSALGLEDQTNFRLPVLSLQRLFYASAATDPRDKLFAFLGVSEEYQEPALRPDYSESVEAVFQRYTTFFLQTNRHDLGTSLLIQAGWRREAQTKTEETLRLPSWVPNFAVNTGYEASYQLTMCAGMRFGYKAAGHTSLKVRFDEEDDGVLYIRGSEIGIISRLIPPLESSAFSDSSDPWQIFVDYFDEVDAMFLSRPEPYRWSRPEETATDILWRTLIANVGLRPFTAEDSYGQHYAKLRDTLQEIQSGDFGEDILQRAKTVFSEPWVQRWITLNTAFVACETESGLLGLVPRACKVGDKVCVLLGGHMPFVLHPINEDSAKYELMGGCYMHGIMQGEAVESETWKEEEFHLE